MTVDLLHNNILVVPIFFRNDKVTNISGDALVQHVLWTKDENIQRICANSRYTFIEFTISVFWTFSLKRDWK